MCVCVCVCKTDLLIIYKVEESYKHTRALRFSGKPTCSDKPRANRLLSHETPNIQTTSAEHQFAHKTSSCSADQFIMHQLAHKLSTCSDNPEHPFHSPEKVFSFNAPRRSHKSPRPDSLLFARAHAVDGQATVRSARNRDRVMRANS